MTVAERIARDIRALPGVMHTLTSVGIGSASFTGSSAGEVNSAAIYVKLKPRDDRDLTQDQLIGRAREILTHYPKDLRTSVGQAADGPGGGEADVQFTLTGPDLDKLNTYSQALLEKIKQTPNVADADTSLVYGKPELRVEIDRQRAGDLGVRVSDIEQALNTLVAGQVVSTFSLGRRAVRRACARRHAVSHQRRGAAQMTVFSTNTRGWVPLDEVVRIKSGDAPSSIGRLDRQRQVTLTANILPGGSQQKIISSLNQYADDLHMEPGYHTALVGTSKELGRTGYYFILAFSLTFIFMYIVLAAQFESFHSPVHDFADASAGDAVRHFVAVDRSTRR